ncbi:MAG: (2Fe-2S)-binding protein [Bacilli bacterium]|nr:(2Fe-2S)-binding protein [Bacilli bacterium]MBN2877845.1 (2Fe-2S)-binding protein [Bacilli bacterium]
MSDKDKIICRCEDVTLEELKDCFKAGYTTFEEIKRILRIGMGPCQGQTCANLIQREIAIYLKQPVESIPTQKTRPLTSGVILKDIAESHDE